jgi:phage tail sheath protein FI
MSQINETAIRTPGVYTTEIPTLPPSVAQVSTAVPAFIGYTQKRDDEDGNAIPAGTIKPIKIFSLAEYVQYFGLAENETTITVTVSRRADLAAGPFNITGAIASIGTPSPYNMYYSVRLYFENGGGPCYIVSVGLTATPANLVPADLQGGLTAIEAFDEPTLILFPEGINIPEANYYGLVGLAIDQCANLQDRFTLVDVHTQAATTNGSITRFRGPTGLTKPDNLNYAAAYYPSLRTLFDYRYQDADVVVTTNDTIGNTNPPTINPGPGGPLNNLLATEGAIFHASKAAIRKLSPTLPPSPAMAGIYAKVDNSRGVWKAPANVGINSIYETTDFITDAEQGDMNVDPTGGKSVNAIRAFNGKGILVWGARTLDANSAEWRYISVRRLFITIEESAKKATFPFVFEPNDANTWVKVRAMLENYLTLLWRQGALAGAKAEHAFFVKCGLGTTMTSQDILDGKLIVEIGLAAVRPAEFIILRFMHKLQES